MNHIGRSFAIAFIFLLALAVIFVTPKGRQFAVALSSLTQSMTANLLRK